MYLWKRESIFGACLIETSVVDAHPKLSIGLGDDNMVGQPPRVVDLPNKAGVEQLFDLFTNEVLPLNGLFLGLLPDQPGIRVDLQMVLNHFLGIPGNCDSWQANMSTLVWRKATSASSYLLSRSPVMWVVWCHAPKFQIFECN
jgi:hypothetical protein